MLTVIRQNKFEIDLIKQGDPAHHPYPFTLTENECRQLIEDLRKVLGDPHTQDKEPIAPS